MKTDEEINELIDEWHKNPNDQPLHEYLGMTWEEYHSWVMQQRAKK